MAKSIDFNAADEDFVSKMIPHHRSAVKMAKAVIADGTNKQVRGIAEDIIKAQTAEIEVLQKILDDMGGKAKPMDGMREAAPAVEREIRSFAPAEIRAESDGIKVSGYAAVFGQQADIAGMFNEKIDRGAFTDAIGRDDVVFLINHDGLPLARTRSGTLTLSEDAHGLRMDTTLDATDPDVISIIGKMKRGDLDKMSFAFIPEVEEWNDSGQVPVRTIKKARLFDVSVVTTPAYDGTSIGLRSLEAYRAATRTSNFNAAARRLRMKMDLRLRAENG